MSTKLTGGEFSGRLLKTPRVFNAQLRPTASRVRESLFNILSRDISGRKVLDLFAGIGTLGFESLSRGAKSATFVDHDTRNLDLIRQNAEALKLSDKAKLIKGMLPKALSSIPGAPFDLLFIDPPYERGLDEAVLKDTHFVDLLHEGSVIIVEQSKHSDMLQVNDSYELVREHRVGDTILCFLRFIPDKI